MRVILVLGALIALGPLTIDMYLPALPAIADDLNTSSSAVQLTLAGTLVGLALGQLIIGPLSDIVGRRLPLIVGTGVHILASVACIVAPNIAVLGGLRVVQGLGAAAAAVVAMAIVRDLFSGRAAATVLSRLMLVMGVAPVLAPSLGGAVLLVGSWRLVFAALAIMGVALMTLAIVSLRETLPPERRRASGVMPVMRTYRSLLRDAQFVVLVLVAALAMASLFAYIAGSSFVLQEEFGLDEQQFAIVFAAGAISLIGASQLNVLLLGRFAPVQIVLTALSFAVFAGAVMTVLAITGVGGMAGFVVPLWFVLGAVGFVMPNAPALALSRHGEAAGGAAALLGAAQFGLGAIVAPIVGVLGNDAIAVATTMVATSAAALIALGVITARSSSHR
ncbi:multidrug effflux MFS transporter [Rhodococcus sp. IEGM 1401]|uniref:multidrug effflux MFS transporter n=1 Tax=Rhodococcus sp. IEGM 1372 TaxID=3047087 RepID=UPI0022B5411B|nr:MULTISPECIES: multidrug effflux MFS transporter [unclassified Rhodococcus (in: high G+C Gram-positive bacteria)]MCZ4562444.1 multidrug effflux MFS transporter [Rhodococcus sp. IEGM 1401]MDI9922486.1 multidrug effflux MFS transporter [Rhodococcus sp. IEGM 1372]MDV8035036.1 multidrug effflux MFS transporter [Rhodococcus sp. IEGM 1414]MDV8054600.1 multidrug effflux MFS transporter [Rhodococcus sp. IEGM 1343]MDV8078956.1 multidrug effflux MFS transporter [Rhodococcus sp. IEGM 1370]